MKKLHFYLLSIALAAFIFAGCSKDEEEKNTLKVGEQYKTTMTSCTFVKYARFSPSDPYNIEVRICTNNLSVNEDGVYEGSGDVLLLDLYSLEEDLKEGTYTCKSSRVGGVMNDSYSFYQSFVNGIKANDAKLFSSGYAKVTKTTEGYEIDFNLIRYDDGSVVKGVYTGGVLTIGSYN